VEIKEVERERMGDYSYEGGGGSMMAWGMGKK